MPNGNFVGVIIEESLEDKSVLRKVKLVSTKIEKVTKKHQTPWLSQWTIHTVEVPKRRANEIAEEISNSLDGKHAWYADFKNKTHAYIIFRNKIFFIDRTSQNQYDEAKEYGLALGIPEHQIDFHPEIRGWER